MVDIHVGPSKKLFRVHKRLLCSKVTYFDKMFTGGFKEATEQVATLPEVDPVAFSLFLEWIYTGRFAPAVLSKDASSKNPLTDRAKLYGFAEYLCYPELMDYTITSLIQECKKHNKAVSTSAMIVAYKTSPHGSHIRKFVAHSLHWLNLHGSREMWKVNELAEALAECKDLAVDLLDMMRSQPMPLEPNTLDVCHFHVHKGSQACKFTEKDL